LIPHLQQHQQQQTMSLNPDTNHNHEHEEYDPLEATFRTFLQSLGMRMVISCQSNNATHTATRFCGYIATKPSIATLIVDFALLNDQRTLTLSYHKTPFASLQWDPEQTVDTVFGDAAVALEKQFAALEREVYQDVFTKAYLDDLFARVYVAAAV
jgi:hypothetical protein